jgi:hypothetical protein
VNYISDWVCATDRVQFEHDDSDDNVVAIVSFLATRTLIINTTLAMLIDLFFHTRRPTARLTQHYLNPRRYTARLIHTNSLLFHAGTQHGTKPPLRSLSCLLLLALRL